jgi:hypothetical protein
MLLIALSLALIAISASFYIEPEKKVNVSKIKKINLDKCEKGARAEMYQTSSNEKKDLPEITIFYRGLDDWKSRLYSASFILSSSCSDFELVEFCMGEQCIDSKTKREISGVYMELKHKAMIVK